MMLKIIFVLVFFEAQNTCYGDTNEDWRSRGWYRPRRNYPSQSQSQNAFEIKSVVSSLNHESQKPVTSFSQSQSSFGRASNQRPQTQIQFGSFGQTFQSQNDRTRYNQSPGQNSFQNDGINSQSAFGTRNSQNYQSGDTFGARKSGSLIENGFSSNAQTRNSYESSFTQNSRADNVQNTQNQNSFGFGYNRPQNQNTFGTGQSQNSFGNSFTQNTHNQNVFGANFNQKPQNSFGSFRQNPQSYNAFGTTYNQNTRQRTFGSGFAQSSKQYQNITSNLGSSSFARGQSIFKGPDYLPPYDKPKPPYIAPGYLPASKPAAAMAMRVLPEPEDDPTTPKPSTPFDEESSTLDDLKVRRPGLVLPAMAMRVPPEPEDPNEPTPTPRVVVTPVTTPSTTTTTTPPTTTTTTTTTPPPTTPPPQPTTTTTTPQNTRPFTYGSGFAAMARRVPPEPEDDPTTPKPSTPFVEESSTLDDLKVTKPGQVLPAMAMRVLPEPEDPDEPTPTPRVVVTPVTTPSTTTTTTPPTTTTTKTTTPPPTTTTTPPPTTTTTTTPPPTTTTTTTTPPPQPTTTTTTPPPTTTTIPPSTKTTPTSTTTPDPNRMSIEETPTTTTTSTTTLPPPIPPIDPYKAPEYLPPKNTTSVPPKPAMAMPVPPEPECDPLDPTTYPYPLGIDQRNFGENPCTYVPIRTTTKKPFVGPAYLPPVVNTRVGRSPKTLRLADVEGARPVWHAGLYTKTTAPYKQICGGSIVRMDVVITAAHCVWNDDTFLEPAENYAVGANKIYRPWTEPHDKRAQHSDIREIKVPPRFRGGKTSFQDDIALLKLVTPFSYARGLRPVCVNFDDDFDTEQLSEGNSGTVAGWGYTDDVGSPTQYLLWLELPYVDIEKCIAGADDAFLKYITSDKICAGENHTGKALCKGDSGGGLVFWHGDGDLITPYLRGIASASARADNKECNVDVVGGFTQIAAHRRFLMRHIPEIDQNCRYHYFN